MHVGYTVPSPNTSIWPNTLAYLSQFFSIWSDFKMLKERLVKVTNHLRHAKPKEQPKMSSKENKFFHIVKHFLFHIFFLRFDPPTSSGCITFSFLVQIEQFKLLWICHLKVYKSCFNSKGDRIIFLRIFFRGFKNRLWIVWWRIFL